MSPTSYQAAPPRAIDTTRLAALLQPHPHQVPDKCPELGHADAQTAPYVQPRRVRKCSELLKCCRCPSPKLYRHLEGLPTSALFGFAPGQTGRDTHMGSQFPGEESPDRTIQTRPRALFTGFSSGDRALGSAVVTMMQSAKSLARSHASQRCGRNPAVWSSLAQSEMCPVLMIIVNIFRK